jgi:hypothetical protein
VHDSFVRLLDSAGNIVAENDDGGGDPGSTTGRDSSLVAVVPDSGTYYILEGSWSPYSDEASGWAEAVPDGSTYKVNISVDVPPQPAQPGLPGSDTLAGGAGSDLLDGGLAADTLIGGGGEDSFRFSTALDDGNVDRVADFDVGADTFLLDSLVFEALDARGPLALGAFHRSASGLAHDADDRILYDTDGGFLSYDADGTGADEAIQFARLNANLALSASDFTVI